MPDSNELMLHNAKVILTAICHLVLYRELLLCDVLSGSCNGGQSTHCRNRRLPWSLHPLVLPAERISMQRVFMQGMQGCVHSPYNLRPSYSYEVCIVLLIFRMH